MADIYGTQGSDVINGKLGKDTIIGWAKGGDYAADLGDELNGLVGDDFLTGGGGNDTLNGGRGRDGLNGGRGDDTLNGGPGNDRLLDSYFKEPARNDVLNGQAGDDTLLSYKGADTIDGGIGNDTAYLIRNYDYLAITNDLTFTMRRFDLVTTLAGNGAQVVNVENISLAGGKGDDAFTTLSGEDTLLGDSGNDTLDGGDGDDRLEGELGNDRLYGRRGNDALRGGSDRDVLYGGSGNDSLATGDLASLDDGRVDLLHFRSDFGQDELNYFYDGSARLVFKGYTEDDLTITEANGEIRLVLDDGVHSGSVTILAHNGTFDASDYSFI